MDDEGESEFEPFSTSGDYVCGKKRPKTVVTKDLTAAFDRVGVSNRSATYLVAETARSLGHEVNDLAINRESIRKARLKHRKQIAQTVKSNFDPAVPLVIHWDGKMLPDITGNELVERLPVLVSGYEVEQLLGVPKLPNGTGEAISSAVLTMVQEWRIESQVKAICFDTTAANTGRINGACGAIEAGLKKNLLYLACRHHVHEVVIGDVFKYCFGVSSGPEIGLFKRFQDYWPNIDRSQFQTANDDEICVEVMTKLGDLKSDIVAFSRVVLTCNEHVRDDYRELLELTVLFLGDIPPRGARIMAPGAMHRARWMAKLLYCMKIWMFKKQFRLTTREEAALRNMSLFCSLLYTKQWTLCPNAASSPANDLSFLKLITRYNDINAGISNAAVQAMLRHLWYLSEELIALAFFDDEVDKDTKRKMVNNLSKQGVEKEPRKRILIEPKAIPELCLHDFVTSSTMSFFDILGMKADFIRTDPDNWESQEDFQLAKKFVYSLAVVNDRAERAVKLIQDFNTSITRSEEQRQYLLQVVSSHRKKYPEARKSLFVCEEMNSEHLVKETEGVSDMQTLYHWTQWTLDSGDLDTVK